MQADLDVPPFHYGTHYSAAGVVLYYLIRLEPFTGLSRTLQVRRDTRRAAPWAETPFPAHEIMWPLPMCRRCL
jgi:hypothetical protein